ncbi:hypothetical protein RhiirC2_779054 [Rhizophagus irregularis]|uniref:Uncharacterized protein n=1 Tax=Rhizophagus irregularis TaxID=588596 RepID=A0A2N1NAH5_9GLOM|nr:hypothetical protein RhiirC2_779054 [Rhizophagus irregularis]
MSESQQREKIGIGSMVISFMLEIIVITQLYSMDDMLIMVAIRSKQFLDIRSIGDSIQMTTRTDCIEETLRRFVERNMNNVNVYIRTYKVQNAYLIVDPESYQCLIIYHGGEKDYFLWSGWKLSIENTYDGKVYDELIVLAESCISSSFEGRDKITPDDDYKIRKKTGCLY